MKLFWLIPILFLATKIWAQTCTCTCAVVPAPSPTPTVSPTACRVGTPLAPRATHRGMYVSIYATAIGQYSPPSQIQNILGDRGKEDDLLRYSINSGVDSLSYYNLNSVLSSPTATTNLQKFIAAARACGVGEHNAVGSEISDWDKIKAFGQFDGAVTEIEFWNDPDVAASYTSYLSNLQYIRKLGLRVYTYLGWLNRNPGQTEQQIANQIAPLIDRAYLHCYVKDATTAYNYCKSRIGAFQNAKSDLQIYPIYSAEAPGYSAGADVFMGSWLRLNSMAMAESLFKQSFTPPGFQYYEYGFMQPQGIR